MAAVPSAHDAPAFDLKSASMSLLALVLQSADLAVLRAALEARSAQAPQLFDNDPLVIDLSQVAETETPLDFPALVALLREHRLLPVAVRGGSEAQREAAREAGLSEAPEAAPPRPAPPPAAPAPAAEPAPPPAPRPTLIVERPLRSGQQVVARDCDLVMLAAVNFGAEVIADGSIHVYAPLRGRAIAGARGNTQARIFSTCMQAQLVSIAGTYLTTDTPLPADVAGQPAQVRLDGETLVFEPLRLQNQRNDNQ